MSATGSNCGECLMLDAEIALIIDGKCPRCEERRSIVEFARRDAAAAVGFRKDHPGLLRDPNSPAPSLFHVQVKAPGRKRFDLLGSGGRVTSLRVHAIQFYDRAKADSVAKEIEAENAGWSAKVVQRR